MIMSFFQKFNHQTTINEFKDIKLVQVIKTHQMIVRNGAVEKYEYYYIETSGINMIDILLINIVDSSRTGCNNVMETFRFSGVSATKLRITSELNNVLGADMGNLPSVYSMFANIMLAPGYPTAISDSGFSDREPNDVLLRMSIKSPMDWIGAAAANSAVFKSLSPSSDIVLGQAPRYIGTARNAVILDMDFIANNSQVKKSRASEL
jgi:DNA-directed RNA polymerase II subunit RPB1